MILTGSEVTLRSDLPQLARMARASGFEHVRIQTHGMRLAEEAFCRELSRRGWTSTSSASRRPTRPASFITGEACWLV